MPYRWIEVPIPVQPLLNNSQRPFEFVDLDAFDRRVYDGIRYSFLTKLLSQQHLTPRFVRFSVFDPECCKVLIIDVIAALEFSERRLDGQR